MTDEKKPVTKELTEDQQKVAADRAAKGLCPVCGEGVWFCGGVAGHLKTNNKR